MTFVARTARVANWSGTTARRPRRWRPRRRRDAGSSTCATSTPATATTTASTGGSPPPTAPSTPSGCNRLPGWTSGKPETQSAWTVPVFGNNTGEPCHDATFATSWCQQAWRWNLDYVVDPHGNAVTYFYAQETNHYAREPDGEQRRRVHPRRLPDQHRATGSATARSTPSRGSARSCSRRRTAASPTPPAPRRRRPTGRTPRWTRPAPARPVHHKYNPTFWTHPPAAASHHAAGAGTGAALRRGQHWTLTQSSSDPGDGTGPASWLASIQQTGCGATTSLPDGDFAGVQLNNRVDRRSPRPLPAMNWGRRARSVRDRRRIGSPTRRRTACPAPRPARPNRCRTTSCAATR